MGKTPLVSVIIPVYNDSKRLKKCLTALTSQSASSVSFEIIVIDNNSTEPIADIYQNYNVRFFKEVNQSSYAARNLGISKAKGRYLAFTDADCIPNPDWIEHGLQYFEQHPEVDFFGGKIQMFFENTPPTGLAIHDYYHAFHQNINVRHHNYAVTANMWARAELFSNDGMFNEKLSTGGDMEWGRLMIERGFSISYAANVSVGHPCRETVNQFYKKLKRVQFGQVVLASEGRISSSYRPFSYRTVFRGLRLPIRAMFSALQKKELAPRLRMSYAFSYITLTCLYWIVIFPALLRHSKIRNSRNGN